MLEFEELFELLKTRCVIRIRYKSINYIIFTYNRNLTFHDIVIVSKYRRYILYWNAKIVRIDNFRCIGNVIELKEESLQRWLKEIYPLVLREKLLIC